MVSRINLLAVDDDPVWRENYMRIFAGTPGIHVETAADSETAVRLVERMAFNVAFVDVSLEQHDERDKGGLDVAKQLHDSGDGTQIILVTGRGLEDSISITANAFRDLKVFHVLRKADTGLAELRSVFSLAIESTARHDQTRQAYLGLRGRSGGWKWDSEMLGLLDGRVGSDGLERFCEHVAGDFVPLVSLGSRGSLRIDEAGHVAAGRFLSRAIGRDIYVVLGASASVEGYLSSLRTEGREVPDGPLGAVLKRYDRGGLAGVVFEALGEVE